ncbi:MAG: RecX family transcriptional regulator [Spirochaetia bacterium]|nr:RecX family transcriptional regulator [Spirochaetia bacterium]
MNIPDSIIRFLNYRDRSIEEIKRYLRRKSICSESEIQPLIQALLDAGFADDRRFSDNRIRYRMENGYGPFYIARELSGLGVPNHLFKPELARMDEQFAEAARKYAGRLQNGKANNDPEKLERRLLGRGFATNQVKAALKSDDSVE